METFDRGLENNNSKLSEVGQSFDNDSYEEQLSELKKEKELVQKDQQKELNDKIGQLFEDGDKKIDNIDNREKVQEFIRKNCSEPIENVNTIIPYKKLLESLIQSAENEFERVIERVKSSKVSVESEEYKNAFEIKNKLELFKKSKKEGLSDDEKKQIKGLAKDKRLYELPAYKQLIEKWWFILPSDARDYYDSAEQASVYHLWIDYNVEAGTEVKAMYKWTVVSSGPDWWFWHKVIIEHKTDSWIFYSLYGHLGFKNLPTVWQPVEKGMKIWEVWIYEENWGWNNHLHFQIMESQDSQPWYYKGKSENYNVITWNYDVLDCFGKK